MPSIFLGESRVVRLVGFFYIVVHLRKGEEESRELRRELVNNCEHTKSWPRNSNLLGPHYLCALWVLSSLRKHHPLPLLIIHIYIIYSSLLYSPSPNCVIFDTALTIILYQFASHHHQYQLPILKNSFAILAVTAILLIKKARITFCWMRIIYTYWDERRNKKQ